jgi:hypothetical protein
VRALARQASPRLAVVVAARCACHSPVVPVVPAALACLSVRHHPVVAVAAARRLVVPAVPVAPVHQLAELAVLAALVGLVAAARICCWRHGSRVVRRRASGWLTVAG